MHSAADFLIECLAEDALLLDNWATSAEAQQPLTPDAPYTVTAPPSSVVIEDGKELHPPSASKPRKQADTTGQGDEESALAMLEFQRRRNRESMQRSRLRQKTRIESMRTALQTLTLQFELLQEQQRSTNDTRAPPEKDAVSSGELEAAYVTLAETSHRLKAEQFMLQRLIVEHDKTELRLLDAINTCASTDMTTTEQRITAMAKPHLEPAAQFFEYSDISQDQAQDAINSCYQRIVHCEQTARPLADWLADVKGPSCTFGWTATCNISSGTNFFLSMTKRLPGLTAQEAMERSWAVMSRARRADKSPTRRLARSAVLQKLNDSTYVVGDDLHHPIKDGVRMRTITVRFLTTTDRGFAVGLGTVIPQDPALRRHALPAVDYMDVFSWHDFAHDEDGTGCVVTLTALTQYDTKENLHLRLVNALCSTWRWENEVMRSPRQLLADG